MKTIIAGGRDYQLTDADKAWLDTLGITHVINGGAKGADDGGVEWAVSRGISVQTVQAEWDTFGRAAGPMRNAKMAALAEQCVLFPGGKGTESMKNQAMKRGLKVIVAPRVVLIDGLKEVLR